MSNQITMLDLSKTCGVLASEEGALISEVITIDDTYQILVEESKGETLINQGNELTQFSDDELKTISKIKDNRLRQQRVNELGMKKGVNYKRIVVGKLLSYIKQWNLSKRNADGTFALLPITEETFMEMKGSLFQKIQKAVDEFEMKIKGEDELGNSEKESPSSYSEELA